MSAPRDPIIEADFQSVIELLTNWGIIKKSPPGSVITTARKVHKATYSLILWRFRLRKLPENSRVFIDEIASDALQILPQVLMGYSKTATLLTRGIVENTLRHIYFADHVIEFGLMNREKKWFLTMEDYAAYTKKHPRFEKVETKFDAINRLITLHSDLSAGIHGRTVRDLETRTALKKITYDQSAGDKHAKAVESCAQAANFLLAVFHRQKVQKFAVGDRRIIMRSMPKRAREVWADIDD
jgi:hypothetical protein